MAKRNYSDKLRIQLSSRDTASVWKCLKDITNYKTPSPSTVENQQLADNLNAFYCRFEKTPHTQPERGLESFSNRISANPFQSDRSDRI